MPSVTTDKGKGKSAIRPLPRKAKIGIVLYGGAKAAAVHGLTDLFETANSLSADGGENRAQIQVSHWGMHPETGEPECVFESYPDENRKPDCLIFPPTLEIDPAQKTIDEMLRWANAQHASGTLLCSVCGGAFLLARTGLLNGRSATTHWSYSDILATSFPEVRVDSDELIIDLGDVITAGGVMAWLDLGLRLIDRYLGPVVMVKTAHFFLADPAGRQQRFYANFSPRLHHGDAAILRVQLWLQTIPVESANIDNMAKMARLGQRTFLRRFQTTTGLTPTEYMQHVKVQKARELLEFTTLSIKEISWKVGYEDTGAFRRIFRKLIGLSPSDYRGRFGTGANLQVTDVDRGASSKIANRRDTAERREQLTH